MFFVLWLSTMLTCSQAVQYEVFRSGHIKSCGIYRWIRKLSECELGLTQRNLIRVVARRSQTREIE